jgi:hypothetical protein
MNDRFTKSKDDHLLFTFSMFVSPVEHCSLENFSGCIAVDF